MLAVHKQQRLDVRPSYNHLIAFNSQVAGTAARVATAAITDCLAREALERWSNTSKSHGALSEKLAHSCKGVDGFAGAYNEENTVNADGLLVINKDWKWDKTWRKNKTIRRVVLLPGVKKVGAKAFDKCHNLKSVTFPDGLERIGDWAFRDCSKLTSVTFPEGLKTIGDWAFRCCNLTSVTLPEGLEIIGQIAFENCKNLKSVTLPSGIEWLLDAFHKCSELKSVEFAHCTTLSPASLLYLAIFNDDPTALRKAIDRGADCNIRDFLLHCIKKDKCSCFEILFAQPNIETFGMCQFFEEAIMNHAFMNNDEIGDDEDCEFETEEEAFEDFVDHYTGGEDLCTYWYAYKSI